MERKILEVGNLCKYYGRSENQTKALDGISFQVFSGEFLGIMGSSGSGKSTLLNCIAAVIRPDSGFVAVEGTPLHLLKGAELAEYRGKISFCLSPFTEFQRRRAERDWRS